MHLHVLTAITRAHNLSALAQSLTPALAAGWELDWHWAPDLDLQHVGGQALKNAMIDRITDGWIAILDDDNACHPDFFVALRDTIDQNESARMVVAAQQHRNGWVRRVSRAMLRASHVDAGQVVIRRDAIGDIRIPLDYCGDGAWIEMIANSLRDEQIAYMHEARCYYNWLRADQ